MRGFVLLAFLSLIAASLAGCSGKTGGPDADPSGTGSPSGTMSGTGGPGSSGTGSATQTGSSSPTPGAAPIARLTSNVTTGTIPLAVSFTLNGTDVDADALTYVLSFGDNSTNLTGPLPAADVTYTFGGAGNFTVELTVSDGKLTGSASVTIAAVAPGAAGVPPPVTFTGTAFGECDPIFGTTCTDEDLVHAFTVTEAVTGMHVLLTWDPVPGSDLDFYVHDAKNTQRGASTCANFQPADDDGLVFTCNRAQSEEATIAELIPDDAGQWKVTIHPFQAPMVDYTLTITFT